MIQALATFLAHIPESVGLFAAGVAMTATAAGLRNFLKMHRAAKSEESVRDLSPEHETEG